tara:strand:+ start:342 stop:1454 length:1113 start_codon:yes stop_codon:yes gene_type:complete
MNICYISNSAAPSKNASSLQTAKLCEALSKIGHKVKLVLPDTGYKDENYNNFYNIKNKFEIKTIKYFKKFPTGINYYLYSLFSILISNQKNQNLYITRNFFTSLLLCFFNKKHILEVHDDIQIEGRIVKIIIKYFKYLKNKNILKIITTTKTLEKKYHKSYFVSKNKLLVLHNASSIKLKFKKYKSLNKKLKIGYFGSIYKSRGLDMLIKLSKEDKNNTYFIYGGTKQEIENLNKKYSSKNLYFQSYIPYSKIKKKLENVDICLLPYTNKITVSGNVGDISKFTSPLKVFDYMITGKLIICSNFNVIKEVLKHDINSILINKKNCHVAWLKEIKNIKCNIKKFNKLRLNAYRFANKEDAIWRAKKIMSSI